jgi:uncharacterized protein YkwD
MNLGIRPVSVLMRSLLSRGPLIGVILLAVVGIGYAAPPPHSAPPPRALLAQSAASTTITQIFDPASELLPREVARPTPTPSAQPRVVAARVPQRTARPKPLPAPAAPPQVTVGSGQWGLINQDRQAAGLAPLQWSPCLANVATGQAARMAAQGYISHANGRSLDLACHLGSRASESIGFQGGGINDAAMNAWFMGDPIHRANIMGPYHYVGVAWVIAANGTAYLAIEFG